MHRAIFAVLMLVLFASAPHAQSAPQNGWLRVCEGVMGTDGKEARVCETLHERFDTQSGMVNFSAALRDTQLDGKDSHRLVLMVPPDVLLRAGVRITIFSKDAWQKVLNGEKSEGDDRTNVRVLELGYTHCYPSGCFTAADATAEIIALLKDGGGLSVLATVRLTGEPSTFRVSLAGFAEALAGEPLSLGAWLTRRGK